MKKSIALKIIDQRIKEHLPKYATEGSAAVDLHACVEHPVALAPGDSVMVETGIAIHINDPGLCAVAMPRSGLGSKGLVLANTVGLIDSDYQGPLKLVLFNRGRSAIVVQPFDRVAQLLILPVLQVQFNVVEDFESTSARGVGGFGSSGVGNAPSGCVPAEQVNPS